MNQYSKPITVAVCIVPLLEKTEKESSVGKNIDGGWEHTSTRLKLSYIGGIGIGRVYQHFNFDMHLWGRPDERLLADAKAISMKIPNENLTHPIPYGDYNFEVGDRIVAVCSHIQHSCIYVTVQKYSDLLEFFSRLHHDNQLVRNQQSHGEFDQLLTSYKTADYEKRHFADELMDLDKLFYPLASSKSKLARLTRYLLVRFFKIKISKDEKHAGAAIIKQVT